mmetsp:Transcript_12734/g.35283  ORF Transcript_12734/g.35283 Transcript_12734/m.35283 type:complete len:275 (-) Transcript_12734:198-1022(-)
MNSLQQIMCTKQHEHESYCSCIERRFFEEMIRAKRSEVRLQGIISDLKDKQDCLIREIYQNRANVRSERILVQKEIEALEVHIGNMQRLIDKIGSAKQAQNLSHSAALEELFRTHQAKLTTVECAFKEQLHHVRKDLEARNLELEKRAGTTSKDLKVSEERIKTLLKTEKHSSEQLNEVSKELKEEKRRHQALVTDYESENSKLRGLLALERSERQLEKLRLELRIELAEQIATDLADKNLDLKSKLSAITSSQDGLTHSATLLVHATPAHENN